MAEPRQLLTLLGNCSRALRNGVCNPTWGEMLWEFRSSVPGLVHDSERLDWLQRQYNDEATGSIGDVLLSGSWGGGIIQVGSGPEIRAKGTLRDAIDAAMLAEVPDGH